MNNIYDPIEKLLGEWSRDLNLWSILLRLTISIVVSGIVGWKDQIKDMRPGLEHLFDTKVIT